MPCSVNFLNLEAIYSLRIFIYSICASRGLLLTSVIYWSTFKHGLFLFLIWNMFVVKIFLHIMVSNRKKLETNLKSGSLSSPNLWIAVFGFCCKVIICPDGLNEFISPLYELQTQVLVFLHHQLLIMFSTCCLSSFPFLHIHTCAIFQIPFQLLHLNTGSKNESCQNNVFLTKKN